ncbi:spermidine coumaroyl-CoA acyltransferase [Ricinus communis]|uniref:Anthranilate N-benzoyltransferase protein, putative n=1 Tax=Ricinus communis TaxID=3988 RepID=B9RVG9_RICCO|nr:spermidine coumaroyl-CoA acyltransferase [Ricinus communis]EEF44670.1 Anthranilate N-benzoyltransferase protein, putative [Ricinus communis]|eukprot:XP_002517738.1 spermidine coumaroyl-CoA acyltransferase [Ricinus communis]
MATHQNNIPFLLERKDVVLVKPEKPTPQEVLSFSAIDNDPNLEIICQSIYVYKANPISCNGNGHNDLGSKFNCQVKPADPAILIKDAISKVLLHYYPLAGKLKRHASDGRLSITCNGDGVPFLEATCDCQLSTLNYLDGIDVQIAKQFVFDFPSKSDSGYHPLMFQVTKFSCGGFTIGMGLTHSVADGFGAAQFFRALAELASGKSEPTVKPVWDRERLVVGKRTLEPFQVPLDIPAGLAKSPYLPTADILHECFYLNSETIRKLKANLMKECGKEALKESFTTIEVLGAYIWRSRFRAFKMDPDEKTLFSLTMGIRQHFNPPLPSGYYGNAFVPSNVVLVGRKLNEGPLSDVVKLIKGHKKLCANTEYILKHIEIIEKLLELNIKIESGNGAAMILTDWRQLGLLEEVDFGWKSPVNIIPVPWNMFGYVDLCIFMPPCNLDPSMKGGVRVLVSLPRAVMPKFKEEMDALLQLGDDSADAL